MRQFRLRDNSRNRGGGCAFNPMCDQAGAARYIFAANLARQYAYFPRVTAKKHPNETPARPTPNQLPGTVLLLAQFAFRKPPPPTGPMTSASLNRLFVLARHIGGPMEKKENVRANSHGPPPRLATPCYHLGMMVVHSNDFVIF